MWLLFLEERARDRRPVPHQHLNQFSPFPAPCYPPTSSNYFSVPGSTTPGDVCIEIARNTQHRLSVAQTGQPLHLFSESLLFCLRPTRLGSVDADDTYLLLVDHHPDGNDPPLSSLHSYNFLADIHIHDDTNTVTPTVSSCVQHLLYPAIIRALPPYQFVSCTHHVLKLSICFLFSWLMIHYALHYPANNRSHVFQPDIIARGTLSTFIRVHISLVTSLCVVFYHGKQHTCLQSVICSTVVVDFGRISV